MAAPASIFIKISLFLTLFSFTTCTEFEVGGDDGWVLPKKKSGSDQMYNQWASSKRFKIDDTLHFKYQKDSVMQVNEDEYQACRSSHPLFYSNNGSTVFKLDRPGMFYFISAVAGHCERGQKMIIKVLEMPAASPPDQSQNQNSTTDDTSNQNNAAPSVDKRLDISYYSPIMTTLMVLIFSFLGFMF